MHAPPQQLKHEELIGVKLPDDRHYIATVLVGALETDEEILRRISTKVGTVFNVTGTKYLVTSSEPFRMKKIGEREPEVETSAPRPPKPREEKAPDSERRPVEAAPQVGEHWKPKDPRRKTSFLIKSIDGEHAVTDDGRRIQVARFHRYERIAGAHAQVS